MAVEKPHKRGTAFGPLLPEQLRAGSPRQFERSTIMEREEVKSSQIQSVGYDLNKGGD